MKRTGKYKSPSKIKRDAKRLLDHLFKTLQKMKAQPTVKPKLSLKQATLTSYPTACLVCHQPQCEYDHRHGAYFAIKLALEDQLKNLWPKKPPDDASGLLVATHKESK